MHRFHRLLSDLMFRINKYLIASLSATLLFSPLVAVTTGGSAASIENRAITAFPGSSDGWDFFKKLGPYISDRIPLRSKAIRVDAWVDQNVFGEDPTFGSSASPRVILGENGFLFLADAIDNACSPNLSPTESPQHFKALSTLLAESGRKVAMVVAPDKSSVQAELLPDDLLNRKCFDEYTNTLWNSLDSADIPGFINLRTPLVSAAKSTRRALYLRKDSHWDSAGSLTAARLLINHFDKELWSEAVIAKETTVQYQGDLTGLRGLPETDDAPLISLSIPNVKVLSTENIKDLDFVDNKRVKRGGSEKLIQGKTLFLLDSYGLAALPQIAPFFADLTTVRLTDFEKTKFSRLLNEADNVIIMSVERSFGYRMLAEVGSTDFLTYLSGNLTRR